MTRFANQLNSYTRTRHALYARLLPAFMLMFVTVGLAQAAEVTPITTCPFVIEQGGQYRLAVDCTLTEEQDDQGIALISIQPAADEVDLNLDGHTISGLRTNSGECVAASGTMGISVEEEASNVHIQGGTVKGFDLGILLRQNVTDSYLNGLTVTGNCEGIVLRGSHDSHVTGNNVSRNFNIGVNVGLGSTGNRFDRNLVNRNSRGPVTRGFLVIDSDGNVITSNVISGNGTGVDLTTGNPPTEPGSDNNTIHSNTINDSTPGPGIRVSSGDTNTISSNTANNNADGGIVISGTAGNIIRDNTANNNKRWGIIILGTGNTVRGNTALHNIPLDVEDQNLPAAPPADPCPNIWRDNTFEKENDPRACIQ